MNISDSCQLMHHKERKYLDGKISILKYILCPLDNLYKLLDLTHQEKYHPMEQLKF